MLFLHYSLIQLQGFHNPMYFSEPGNIKPLAFASAVILSIVFSIIQSPLFSNKQYVIITLQKSVYQVFFIFIFYFWYMSSLLCM